MLPSRNTTYGELAPFKGREVNVYICQWLLSLLLLKNDKSQEVQIYNATLSTARVTCPISGLIGQRSRSRGLTRHDANDGWWYDLLTCYNINFISCHVSVTCDHRQLAIVATIAAIIAAMVAATIVPRSHRFNVYFIGGW